jgi:hypothetical protein
MRGRRRASVALCVGVGLAFAGLQATAAAPAQARETARCADISSDKPPYYDGPSASKEYDSAFEKAFHIPYLDDYTPQGIAVWTNWNGHHDDLVLIGMYRKGHRSYLVAIDPDNGKRYATLQVSEAHLGGIAIAGKYLFAQDAAYKGHEPVRRYKLSTLEKAIKKAHKHDSKPFVAKTGGVQFVHGASFMTSYKGHVWAGHFDSDETDKMYEYRVSDGKLKKVGSAWEVPAQTQGVLVLSDRFIFNVSNVYDQGSLIVASKHHHLDNATTRCFGVPAMGESLARDGDDILLDFESGSHKYPQAVNRVTDVHVASLDTVRSLTDHLR